MTKAVLDIELSERGDTLMRVLTVLSRRRCEIVSVDYAAADRHRDARLVVGVLAPERHAHCVEAWLENVVGVRAVSGPGGPRC